MNATALICIPLALVVGAVAGVVLAVSTFQLIIILLEHLS